MPTVTVTFVKEKYALVTLSHIRNISAVTDPILNKLFGPNFFGALTFWPIFFYQVVPLVCHLFPFWTIFIHFHLFELSSFIFGSFLFFWELLYTFEYFFSSNFRHLVPFCPLFQFWTIFKQWNNFKPFLASF